MRAFVDTNILIRHLTGGPLDQAARATRFLAQADELLLADLVVAEVVDVLESFYDVERVGVAEMVRAIIAFDAMRVVDEDSCSVPSRSTRSTVSTSPRRTWSPAPSGQELGSSPRSIVPSIGSTASPKSNPMGRGPTGAAPGEVGAGRWGCPAVSYIIPSSTLATLKSAFTLTVALVPSDFVTCASSGPQEPDQKAVAILAD